MAAIPKTVKYKWTPRDGQDAQEGKPSVTPYRLHPSIIANAKTTEGGTVIDLPIGLGSKLDAVRRFELGDGFGWEDVPPSARSAATLADLCHALKATGNPKYPDAHYDIDKMSPAERNRVALLLFDYWGNTDYRFAVVTSGAFSWDMVNPRDGNDILKALKTSAVSTAAKEPAGVTRQLAKVMVKLPVVTVVSVKPGPEVHKIVPPDPLLTMLDSDIAAIHAAVGRIRELLKRSARMLEVRARLMRSSTALRVLIEQCVGASDETAPRMWGLAAHAKALEKSMHAQVPHLKVAELLAHPNMDPTLSYVMRSELGEVSNIVEEVERLRDALCEKILGKNQAASRCVAFVRAVVERHLRDTAPFKKKQDEIANALIMAAGALLETGTPQAFIERMVQALERIPTKPVLDPDKVKGDSVLEAMGHLIGSQPWTVASIAAGTVNNSVGNLAGPASAFIAFRQVVVWRKIHGALQKGKDLTEVEAKSVLKYVLEELRKGDPPTAGLVKKIEAAVANRSKDQLEACEKDFLNELTAGRQSGPYWRGSLMMLQFVSLIAGICLALSDEQGGASGFVVVTDWIGVGVQSGYVAVSLLDSVVTTEMGKKALTHVALKMPWRRLAGALTDFEKAATLVNKAGMAVGLLGGALGVVAGVSQVIHGITEGDALEVGIGAASAVSGGLTIWYCISVLTATPVPGAQLAAVGMAMIATALSVIKMVRDAATPGTSILANGLLDSIEVSPYLGVLNKDQAFRDAFAALRTGCKYDPDHPSTGLPVLRNVVFVTSALRDAGFAPEHIGLMLEKTGALLMSSPAPVLESAP